MRYLGTAGHCFLPDNATATHGPSADFNAAGVKVSVCVAGCAFGGKLSRYNELTGTYAALGAVA